MSPNLPMAGAPALEPTFVRCDVCAMEAYRADPTLSFRPIQPDADRCSACGGRTDAWGIVWVVVE